MNIHGLILPIRIIGFGFLALAIILLSLAGWFGLQTRTYLQTAASTTGTVVELRESRSSEGGSVYTTVFEFEDASGVTHTVASRWASSPASHAVGEAVTVRYDPASPAKARLEGLSNWIVPFIFGVTSLFPIFMSVMLIWFIPFTIRRVCPLGPDPSGRLTSDFGGQAMPPAEHRFGR